MALSAFAQTNAYPTPEGVRTPAPAGYVPVYISHYGRHGSRWRTADEHYKVVVDAFDSLYQCKGLTPLGEDVRRRLHVVWEDARGRSGNITATSLLWASGNIMTLPCVCIALTPKSLPTVRW